MEEYEEKLLEAIDEDVRSNADLVEKQVNDETDAMREDQIGFYKEGLRKETETYLEGELQDLTVSAATKSSKERLDTKKKLLELRQNLVNQLFENVEAELKKFVQSDQYKEYMKKNLDSVQVSEDGYFEVRESDVSLMKSLLKEKGYKNEVKPAYFAIGGFRYVDEKARVQESCLLDEKRKEQAEWFRDHSDFKIQEREAGE